MPAAVPQIARLLASVAPLVNTTWSGATPSGWARLLRARSTAAAASRPKRWERLEGLANSSLQ